MFETPPQNTALPAHLRVQHDGDGDGEGRSGGGDARGRGDGGVAVQPVKTRTREWSLLGLGSVVSCLGRKELETMFNYYKLGKEKKALQAGILIFE